MSSLRTFNKGDLLELLLEGLVGDNIKYAKSYKLRNPKAILEFCTLC